MREEGSWGNARGHLNDTDRRVLAHVERRYVRPLEELLDSAYAELCDHSRGDFARLQGAERMAAFREIVNVRHEMVTAMPEERRVGWAHFPVVRHEGGKEIACVWSGTGDTELPWPDRLLVGEGVQRNLFLIERSMGDPLVDDLALLQESRLVRRKEALDEGSIEGFLLRAVADLFVDPSREPSGDFDTRVARIAGDIAKEVVGDAVDVKLLRDVLTEQISRRVPAVRDETPTERRHNIERLAKRILPDTFIESHGDSWNQTLEDTARAMTDAMRAGKTDEVAAAETATAFSRALGELLLHEGRCAEDKQLAHAARDAAAAIGGKVERSLKREVAIYDKARLRLASVGLNGAERKATQRIARMCSWAEDGLPDIICEAAAESYAKRTCDILLELSDKYEDRPGKWPKRIEDIGMRVRGREISASVSERIVREVTSCLGEDGWDERRASCIASAASSLAAELLCEDCAFEELFESEAQREVLRHSGRDWWGRRDRRDRSITNAFGSEGEDSLFRRTARAFRELVLADDRFDILVAMVSEGIEAEAAAQVEGAFNHSLLPQGVDADIAEAIRGYGVIRFLPVSRGIRRWQMSPAELRELLRPQSDQEPERHPEPLSSMLSHLGLDLPGDLVGDVVEKSWVLGDAEARIAFPLTWAEVCCTLATEAAATDAGDCMPPWASERHRLTGLVDSFIGASRTSLEEASTGVGGLADLLDAPPANVAGWYGSLVARCGDVAESWAASVASPETNPVGDEWYPEYSAAIAAFELSSSMPTVSRERALRYVITGTPPVIPDMLFVPGQMHDASTWKVVLPDEDDRRPPDGSDRLVLIRHRSYVPPSTVDGDTKLGQVTLRQDHSGYVGVSASGETSPDAPRPSSAEVREVVLALADTVAESVVGAAYRQRGGTRRDWGNAIAYAVTLAVLDRVQEDKVDGALRGTGIADYRLPHDGTGNRGQLVRSIRKAMQGVRNAAREPLRGVARNMAFDVPPRGLTPHPLSQPWRYAYYGMRIDHGGIHSTIRLP